MMPGETLKTLPGFPCIEVKGATIIFFFFLCMYLFPTHFPSATLRIQASGIPVWLKGMSLRTHKKMWDVAQ